MAQGFGQVEVGGAHVAVVAGAVAHQVQRAARQHLLRGGLDLGGVGRVQRHGHAAGVLIYKRLQGLRVAGRHNDLRPPRMQQRRCGPANAAGGAHQPHASALPVMDAGIETHGVAQVRLVNDRVISPSRTPNLLIVARLSITRSSIRYIQSSKSTW